MASTAKCLMSMTKTAILQVAKGEIRVDLGGISAEGVADAEAIKAGS